MWNESSHLRIAIHGLVQGVGFRPFVFRMAQACEVTGWVQNTGDGVMIEASGQADRVFSFIARLKEDQPPGARIQAMDVKPCEGKSRKDFVILESDCSTVTTDIPLDVATCAECRRELVSADSRRFRYPFITCASCGPRFTILRALPFDRQNTSMAKYTLCSECQQEYSQPADRRFHAQTISCPRCGPRLTLLGNDGVVKAVDYEAILQAAALLTQGKAVALKGIGGYHIAVDACDEAAVQHLRQRKHRPEKPLAVMFSQLEKLRQFATPSEEECQTLLSKSAPIVLVEARPDKGLAPAVNQGAPFLGAMLPHSPLHILLSEACDRPLVMTSGNLSQGPIITRDELALRQLAPLVEGFLVHDRDILHHADDSVVRCAGRETKVLRLGRGLAPYVIPCAGPSGILALGGHQKNSFALTNQNKLFVSQDMGQLDDFQNCQRLQDEIASWLDLMKIQVNCVLHDQHPDYGSSRLAPRLLHRTMSIPHHEAHAMACLLDQSRALPGLALAWDGWGLGDRGELWGGEFFRVQCKGGKHDLHRIATLRPYFLAGADKAAREPWRSALGIAHVLFGERAAEELIHYRSAACLKAWHGADVILCLLDKQIASSSCRSVGRLFDAVASLLDIKQVCTFEGQAAMLLEGCVDKDRGFEPYPVDFFWNEGLHIMDWRPGFQALLQDKKQGASTSLIATRFHQMWVLAVLRLLEHTDAQHVFLSGGVFQNVYVEECLRQQLEKRRISVHSPQGLPLHDGNLAAGQVHWALSRGKFGCASHGRDA